MSRVETRPLYRARGLGGELHEEYDANSVLVKVWSDGLVPDSSRGYRGYPNFSIDGPTQLELEGAALVDDTNSIRFGKQGGRANPSKLVLLDPESPVLTVHFFENPRDKEDDYKFCSLTPVLDIIVYLKEPLKEELGVDVGSMAFCDAFGEVGERLTSDGWHAIKHTITDAYLDWVAREVFNMATWSKSSRVRLLAFGGVALTNVPKIALKLEALIAAACLAAAEV